MIETKASKTAKLLSIEENSIHDWYSYCREVCILINNAHWENHKLGQPDSQNPAPLLVQIDELLLRGRRKYNNGRLLLGKLKFINLMIIFL